MILETVTNFFLALFVGLVLLSVCLSFSAQVVTAYYKLVRTIRNKGTDDNSEPK